MASRFPRVRSYELMVIFHPETEDESLGELVDRVQSYITAGGGTVTVVNRENPWGRRRLAYPIRHESRDLRDGIYVLVYFETEASRTAEIERELKLNTRIIRYMLIQQSTPTMEPPTPSEEAPAAVAGQSASADGQTTPAAAGQAAPRVQPTAAATAAGAEASPGTPPDVAPAPYEPTGPATAGAPTAAEENLASPALDSSPEPSLPSETLPPADASLVEAVTGSQAPESAEPASDVSAEEAPLDAADLAEPAGATDGASGDNDPNPSTTT